MAVIAKIILGVLDKMSSSPSVVCQTFWWQANINGHSGFSCHTFYVYWNLLDKMSGEVSALCRTSAEVCRTCPAYFVITAMVPVVWQIVACINKSILANSLCGTSNGHLKLVRAVCHQTKISVLAVDLWRTILYCILFIFVTYNTFTRNKCITRPNRALLVTYLWQHCDQYIGYSIYIGPLCLGYRLIFCGQLFVKHIFFWSVML